MLLSEGKDKVIKLINAYSVNGTVTPSTNGARQDINNRMNVLFDMGQKEVSSVKKIHKTKKIIQNPIPTQLANPLFSFDIVQHLVTDIIYSANASKAYTFKVDNISTIYIEEKVNGTWQALPIPIAINHITPIGEFTEYKGLITPLLSTNDIRIRFSGLYPYNIRDIAMFAYPFPSSAAIPKYQRYNLYPMPTDFLQLNKVVLKGNVANSQPYMNTADFFWENPSTIAINYYNIGEYSVFYFGLSSTIDGTTLDSYAFEVSEDAAQCLPYYVAGHLLMDDVLNKSVSNTLLTIYQGKLANLDTRLSNGSSNVENTLFTGTANQKLF